jgi:P4 family phage/plasmid primase-like protien
MSASLYKILESCRVDSVFHSHVSMIEPTGKFQINRQVGELFWEEYCKVIKNQSNPKVGIAEKPQHYLPILVDVDIKIIDNDDLEYGEKLYSDRHLISIVQIYQSVLRKILDDVQDENLMCFVLEKPAYTITQSNNNYIKNGFHLHFPGTFLSKTDQEIHLLPRVKKLVDENKIFEDIGFKNSGDLIDTSYVKVPWLLYGSKKSENMKSYKLTKIISGEGDEISLQEALQDYLLYDNEENLIPLQGREEELLPRVLSIIPFSRRTSEIKSNLTSIKDIVSKKKNTKDQESEVKKYKSASVSEDLKIARELLMMVNDSRADDYQSWMDICWIIYCISEGCEDGLNLFLDFSSRCSDKFDEEKCIDVWNKSLKKGKTLGSLRYYAKMDSPKEYDDYLKKSQRTDLEKNIGSYSHNDIAKYLYKEHENEFVCSSISYKSWYKFENHHWKEMDDGVDLRRKISDESEGSLIQTIRNLGNDYGKKVFETEDDFERVKLEGQRKRCLKVLENLKSCPYKSNILKECMEVFYDETFGDKLDKNPFLVGFKNGVYDLKKFVFREGRPDDFISLQMPIEYKTFDKGDKRLQDVNDFLEKIFPDKSLRDYFMDVSSDVFIGGNQSKKVWFWSGEGDNGKSVTQSIFEKMLGKYAVKLPTSLIVGKRTQSSAASPELVRAGKGVRWAVLQEPDKKDVINIGLLKELSGNDSFFARGLFKEGGEIEPMFKLVVICNDPPSMPYSDKAAWNRIRVIPFESTFCDDCPSTFEEQLLQKRFPKDPYFAEKIPDMIQAFAFILLEHRKTKKTLVEPEKVKLATASYKIKNDIYRQFLEECIQTDQESYIRLPELYVFFKDWFKDSMPNHSIPVKNEVKEYFIRLWGEPEGVKWKGYKLRNYEEEVENGDAIILEEKDLTKYNDNNPLHLM